MQNLIAFPVLRIVREAFIRAHFGNILYGQACNAFFYQKLQSAICDTCFAGMAATRGTSKKIFYQELRLESRNTDIGSTRLAVLTRLVKIYLLSPKMT